MSIIHSNETAGDLSGDIAPARRSAADWTVLVLRVLLAVAFAAAAVQKLIAAEPMVAMFADIGFGQWLRTFTGLVEITAAVMLLVPRTVTLGAVLLVCTMSGAVLTHLLLIGGSPLPAIVLLVLAAVVLVLRLRAARAR